jgi:hypothetical protein
MANRSQPATKPHIPKKCQILISRPATTGQSVSRNYRGPFFGKCTRFENVRKPRKHRRLFAFKFGVLVNANIIAIVIWKLEGHVP